VPPPVTCWDGSEAKTLGACPIEPVSCPDGSTAKTLSACPPKVTPPVVTPEVTCWDGSQAQTRSACPAEPAPPPVEGEVCAPSSNPLFNVPSYSTPMSVTRLGTFPEFGDSHGLSPSEFYYKLQARYNSSRYDAAYLNLVFRSLGYQGGFNAADPSMFSSVTLEKGVKGVLGYGDFHGMQYSQLNVTRAQDLEAFNVRAANGRNVNFMKSCGNFMYVCQ